MTQFNWTKNCFLSEYIDINETFKFVINYGWSAQGFSVPLKLTDCVQNRQSKFFYLDFKLNVINQLNILKFKIKPQREYKFFLCISFK